ncbi:tautomerase family protein [bacterium M00.F.Ca.ET.194.01.1.1]|nr:tautomerase family protein [bacterium M00.F.Ca.ET.194.01.1.1]TGS52177.1 tautomerase family protein [bacterium M00.F.Ca.ET.179.01.1.1]TGV43325.1 tautomerase family protein [bacterium M00.F.Ca.ET.168.01.1.1]
MPLLRVDVVKGRTAEELKTLLQTIHDSMVAAFNVPMRDRYQVLVEHEQSHFILEDTGLGFERSDKRVLIQMTTRPRSREMKEQFYALVVENLGKTSGLSPEDVAISCVENGDVDWSFGYGRAQFLTGEL